METQIPNMVFETLYRNSGHLYVCGDVKMANDVTKALKRIYVKLGKMNDLEAENWIQELKVIHDNILLTSSQIWCGKSFNLFW